MGKVASINGVNVFQYDSTGNKTGSQFFAKASFQGAKKTDPEGLGSDDYLVNVFLADTDVSLKTLVAQFPHIAAVPFTTSGSSLNVHIVSNVSGVQQQTIGAFVVATNSNPKEHFITNELHVSSPDYKLNAASPLTPFDNLFNNEVIFLQNLLK